MGQATAVASSRTSINRYRHATNVNDTFTRADSSSSLGTANTGQSWTARSGTWGIASNQAYLATAAASGLNIATITGGSADGFAEVTIDGTPVDGMSLLFRYSDTSNYMVLARNDAFGTWNVNKVVAGTGTFITNTGLTTSVAGTVARVEYIASDLYFFFNGELKLRLSESTHSANTGVGLRLPAATGTAPRFDNFSAGG